MIVLHPLKNQYKAMMMNSYTLLKGGFIMLIPFLKGTNKPQAWVSLDHLGYFGVGSLVLIIVTLRFLPIRLTTGVGVEA